MDNARIPAADEAAEALTSALTPAFLTLDTLEQLFRLERASLLNFFRRRLRGQDDAEEAVQETFLRISQARLSCGIHNPRAFLYRIATNYVIDRGRAARQERLLFQKVDVDELPEEDLLPYAHHSAEEICVQRDDIYHAVYAIHSLSRRCRRVFVLHKVRGLSYHEVACELGVSKSMVEKYMMSALKTVRQRIAGVAAGQ